jgi:ABC-type multidrug transport system fused ATPase/permease subunit
MKILFRQIFTILNYKEKVSFFILIMLALVNTSLELLSIGLIIPIISIIISPDNIPSYLLINDKIKLFFLNRNFISYLLFTIVIIYFAKNILLVSIHIFQTNYISRMQIRLTDSIFEKFISKNYMFHILNSKPKLILIVISEINTFIGRVISPVLTLITELFIFIGIIIIVLINKVQVIHLLFFLGSISLIYFFYIKNKISILGEQRKSGESNRIRTANETLQFIKEIKIFNKEIFFLSKFKTENFISIEAGKKLTYFNIFPRILTELTLVTFLSAFLFLNLKQDFNLENLIAILAIFAAASYRLLPSVNRILTSFQSLRFGMPVINPIIKYYKMKSNLIFEKKEKNNANFNFKNLILKNIRFNYSKKKLFTNLNFEIKKNQKIAIIGESGSGKTTLINLIIGFLQPRSGKIFLNRKLLYRKNIKKLQETIAYIPQNTCLISGSIIENVLLDSSLKLNKEKLAYSLKKAELIKDINSNKISLHKRIGENGLNLSEGQRQRLSLARAIYHDREILILDEATSNLDKTTEKNIFRSLFKFKNKTIIMVTHSKDNLNFFDKVYEVKNNKISLVKDKVKYS